MTTPVIAMSDGNVLPVFGVAAFRHDTSEQTLGTVRQVLDLGIRHFEISELFGNAHMIMESLNRCGINRERVFISYKVWPKDIRGIDLKNRCKLSIIAAGLDYVDLLVLHAPIDAENRIDQYQFLETLRDEGIAKSFGLSNYSIEHVTAIMKYGMIAPVALEFEVSPFCQEFELAEFCIDNSLLVLSNNPFNKGIRKNHPVLVQLSKDLGLSTEQVLLRWAFTKGFVLLLPSTFICDDGDFGGRLESLKQLPLDSMSALDALNENLCSSWKPVAKEDDD